MHDFPVAYDSVNVDDITDIYNYLTKKYNIIFVLLLRFDGSIAMKCVSLNNPTCTVREMLINLNPDGDQYYPYMVSLDKCNGSCNALKDP